MGAEREQAPEPAGPGACRGKPSCSVAVDAALEHPALEDVLRLDRDQVALGELATPVGGLEQPDGLAHPETLQGVADAAAVGEVVLALAESDVLLECLFGVRREAVA